MTLNSDSGVFTAQEFYNRGVIKLAPDALVYVGGSLTTTVIAPVTGQDRNLEFNDGITNINVQNNVDPPGSSSASIEISTPIYGENSKYWVQYPGIDNNQFVRAPLFVPMMEVKIYFKGRYLVQDKPRYYTAFWGFITNVEENYSGGLYKINLSCADMLHWWSYSKINVHPSLESNIMAGSKQKLTPWGTIFETMNPYQIIYKLTEDMGQHSFVTTVWAAQMTSQEEIYPAKLFEKVQETVSAYWRQRFANIGNLLKMYGINGVRVDKNGLQQRLPETQVTKKGYASKVQDANTPRDDERFSLDVDFIRKFMPFADFNEMGSFENAEYMTKLEVATTIKSRVEFEFFQDVNGNWIFKPPFYNLNTKGILPYTILPSDIINYSVSQDSEGMVTAMTVRTPFDPLLKTTSFGTGVGFHMDIDLMKRFGVRSQEKTVEYIRNQSLAKVMAMSQLNQINSKTITGNVTIPGRPEIRLGYPIYMEHRDSFHYVKSVNHAFDYGSSFTTTLSLETERRRIYNPDTGELQRDKVFRLTNTIPEKLLTQKINSKDPDYLYNSDPVEIKEETLLKGENRVFSQAQGRYTVSSRETARPRSIAELNVTTTTSPYTDNEGFRLIGSFPYGRVLNAINVLSTKTDIPVLKDVYLTTMARPIYANESNSMDILFFDEEGAVPPYLNVQDKEIPRVLGVQQDVDVLEKETISNTQSASDQKKSDVKKAKQAGAGVGVEVNNITVQSTVASDVEFVNKVKKKE